MAILIAQPEDAPAAAAAGLAPRAARPMATPAPQKRSPVGETSRLHLRADDFQRGLELMQKRRAEPSPHQHAAAAARAAEEQEQALLAREHIVIGPFHGDEQDAMRLRRALFEGRSDAEVRQIARRWQHDAQQQQQRERLARRDEALGLGGIASGSSPLRPQRRAAEWAQLNAQWADLLAERNVAVDPRAPLPDVARQKRSVGAGGSDDADRWLAARAPAAAGAAAVERAPADAQPRLEAREAAPWPGPLAWEELQRRQTSEEQRCFVGNEQLSCYPTSGLQVQENTWSKLIWNSNFPEFTNNGGFVDVYLFHQDSDRVETSWTSLSNAAGRLSFQPVASWWQDRVQAKDFNGTSIQWPFYFVVTYAGEGLTGSTTRLSTWYAVQTQLPPAISASRASASAAAASASSAASLSSALASASLSAATATLTGAAASSASASDASASSAFAQSLTSALVSSLRSEGFSSTETLQATATTTLSDGRVITATATGRANGSLVNSNNANGGDGRLATYAIVLIAVFGALALIAALAGAYFVLTAARRRRRRGGADGVGYEGSDRPMMEGNSIDGPSGSSDSDVAMREAAAAGGGAGPAGLATMAGVGAAGLAGAGAAGAGAAAATAGEDASAARGSGATEQSPFSSDEATRMADAFRAALRKPEFASGALLSTDSSPAGAEDETPPEHDDEGRGGVGAGGGAAAASASSAAGNARALLREELAASGTDIRTVDERRRPTVSGGGGA